MAFFKALFDFSFSEFVTTKIIKVLYGITLVIAALIWLGVLVAMFSSGSGVWGFLGVLIIAPIGFVVQVIFTRVGYEILIVVFGIAENTRDMAWALTGGRKAPSASPVPAAAPKPQYPPQPQYPQYPQQAHPAQQPTQYPPQQPPQPPAQQPPQQYPQYPQYPQQPPQPPAGGPQYPQPPQQPKPKPGPPRWYRSSPRIRNIPGPGSPNC